VNVVLDTNVIVSAVLTAHGACARIVDMLGVGAFQLCADDRILSEHDSVLRRPELGIAAENVGALMEFVRHIALPVAATPRSARLPDPDDLPLLEVAAAAEAILVTGNTRHYPKKACGEVRVVSPGEFVEILRHASDAQSAPD